MRVPAETAAKREPSPRRPNRATRRSVIVADRIADYSITVGGMAVILAVFGIMVFLFEVVVPLFTGSALGARNDYRVAAPAEPVALMVDEYRTIGITVGRDGRVAAFHAGTGRALQAPDFDFAGVAATAFASTLDQDQVAFAFADGTVRFGTIRVVSRVLPTAEAPPGLDRLDGRDATDGASVFRPLPDGQVRRSSVEISLGEAETVADDGAAVVAIDYRVGGSAERPSRSFVTLDAKGTLRLTRAESRLNMLTRKLRTTVESSVLPPLPGGSVFRVALTEQADQVLVASEGNVVWRYDTRDFKAPRLAETATVLPSGARITSFGFLIGEQSIVVGGSDGSVEIHFRLARDNARGTDGYEMVRAHTLEPHRSAVVGLNASQRGKTFATMDDAGHVWLRHATSERVLMRLEADGGRFAAFTLAPRADGIVAVRSSGEASAWELHVPHPETTPKTIFGKVWYEGYPEPSFTWQSSSGTDSFEAKFSLIPLIFGTIKATLYSLLFAVPIALLGAIYTSEFLHPSVRGLVKPTMEMMASLPSVVLGFIAALILAPVVETWIAAVVLAFVVLPLGLVAAAYAWQFLPHAAAARLGGIPKLAAQAALVVVLLWTAYALGPAFETLFFAGDFKAWVNADRGTATPFLFLLLLPAVFALATVATGRLYGGRLEAAMRRRGKTGAALLDLARWAATLAASLVLSYLLAELVAAAGFDARGDVVDTYVQRNTLVVGFAMGFAVIPIIYTLSDDALNAVPEHLRAASLACGATPWQTASRVVLPTAVSGVFAAVMIGMGRAVGETMIVVMAAGNTPLLDWNLFNGFRALSANIAVELPEAVKDGTLYRILFLAALTLFIMTFVINTGAELIRQRFRKRSFQL